MSWPHVAVSVVVLILGGHFMSQFGGNLTPESLLEDVGMDAGLQEAFINEGTRRVEKVTEGVYVSRGFSLGNSIMVEAPEGLIIVDTTESLIIAREVFAAFRNISKAPVKAIIYTHHHADHIYGAQAFIEDNSSLPEIWAHEGFLGEKEKGSVIGVAQFTRAMRQFGPYLPHAAWEGLRLRFTGQKEALGYIPPTHFLNGAETNVTLAGLDLTLLHIPGETTDHMGVHIPSRKVLMCGDNIYQAFPNLYALRGTPPRDTMVWVRSLDAMRHLRAEYLIPSHTQPVDGVEIVFKLLTNYRDAIQLVHDQSVRFINKGLVPVDIVQHIKLPPELQEHQYLQELYGTVEWSVKGVFINYLGWFSGNIVDLDPLDSKEKAVRMIQLAGGVGSLASSAQAALGKGDYRWALELASHIFHLNPNHEVARQIRLEAIKALAGEQTSANGRNYYLTTALEDHGLVDNKLPKALRESFIYGASLLGLFHAMAWRLKAEEAVGQQMVIVFNFTDVDEAYTLRLRNCVLDVTVGYSWDWDVKVSLDSNLWRRLLNKEANSLKVYLSGEVIIEGGVLIFRRFMNYIEQD